MTRDAGKCYIEFKETGENLSRCSVPRFDARALVILRGSAKGSELFVERASGNDSPRGAIFFLAPRGSTSPTPSEFQPFPWQPLRQLRRIIRNDARFNPSNSVYTRPSFSANLEMRALDALSSACLWRRQPTTPFRSTPAGERRFNLGRFLNVHSEIREILTQFSNCHRAVAVPVLRARSCLRMHARVHVAVY